MITATEALPASARQCSACGGSAASRWGLHLASSVLSSPEATRRARSSPPPTSVPRTNTIGNVGQPLPHFQSVAAPPFRKIAADADVLVREAGINQRLARLAHHRVARHAQHHDGVRADGVLHQGEQVGVEGADPVADRGVYGGLVEDGAGHVGWAWKRWNGL